MSDLPNSTTRALDRLVSAVSFDTEASCICRLGERVGIHVNPGDPASVHNVLSGTLHLTIEGQGGFSLESGMMVVVPPRKAHRLASSEDPTREANLDDLCTIRPDGLLLSNATEGRAVAAVTYCGAVRPVSGSAVGPFDGMQEPIIADFRDNPFVRSAFDLMRIDAETPGPYSRALVSSVMKSCLIILLRHHLVRTGVAAFPGIFGKPWLANVISTVMRNPGASYNVATLASIGGRSRSVFAREFSELVGITPMEFVMQARLARARDLIVATDASIGQISTEAGFASRTHFNRLFRDIYGTDPSTFRSTQTAKPHTAIVRVGAPDAIADVTDR
jgi:AraC-like DNA-binding protein